MKSNVSEFTFYDVKEDIQRDKAFRGLRFDEWREEREHIHAACPYALQADISRFFYTIYTHSIPWAVLGKEKVKSWHEARDARLEKHWSSKLDKRLQACQSRETFGLPVGPDTSRLVAEILMNGVEKDEEFANAIKGRPICRLVDDYVVGFESESAAHHALTALRRALWNFNLQLNEQKSRVVSSRQPSLEKWRHDLDRMRVADANSKAQREDISRLVDVILHACNEAGSSLPAVLGSSRFHRLKNVEKNFDVILEALFRLARDFPACLLRAMREMMQSIQTELQKPQPDTSKVVEATSTMRRIGDWVLARVTKGADGFADALGKAGGVAVVASIAAPNLWTKIAEIATSIGLWLMTAMGMM
ncbi:MAG: RNA-directed DNA polymerase [Rhodospirillaceae bacterium]